MRKEELAELLNGREYGEEITPIEEKLALENNLLVVFGYSDDGCELRGSISDEIGAYNGTRFFIFNDWVERKHKLLPPDIDRDEEDVLNKYGVLGIVKNIYRNGKYIEAIWCGEEGYSWTYRTELPYAGFDILEGEEKYCRGIVVDLKLL